MEKLSRRDFVKHISYGIGSVASATLLGSCYSQFAGVVTVAKRPNILFILTDNQRWDTIGCAGNPIIDTPNIDYLATRGRRFANAFVTTAICAASRASILTGLYLRRHQSDFMTPPLQSQFADISYPMLLRAAGYRTGYIGKFGIGATPGNHVEGGQMIGLSGPSGAGKTTLINMLGRFYDATEGSITVDGYDVRDVKVKSLRDQIGIVLQDPFLFHGSIAENIAYSKPDASRTEIIAAAQAANAHDFIMGFPDGYDTMVGERGVGISGGEKQRISIARAILKDPRILILDEATSSVDTETESLIQSAIDRLIEGRTTFAIAHRLSTLRKADKLIILDKAEIAEMGTHNELLDNNGLYRRLVDSQSELSKVKAV